MLYTTEIFSFTFFFFLKALLNHFEVILLNFVFLRENKLKNQNHCPKYVFSLHNTLVFND